MPAMIYCHVGITAAEDYATRRGRHSPAHLERIAGLRAEGFVVGGGPAPDGKTADLFYRAPDLDTVVRLVEEDPYWKGGVWTAYKPEAFSQFLEPWRQVEILTDGSRTVTLVEGLAPDVEMASFALIEARGAGRHGLRRILPGRPHPGPHEYLRSRAGARGSHRVRPLDAGHADRPPLHSRPLTRLPPPDPRYPPDAFRRLDETPDPAFYATPRFVTHIDAGAIAAVTELYREHLPAGGAVLDLMSSWVSHLPMDVSYGRVTGLGMNADELTANPRLDGWVVHDLNAEPRLPFAEGTFEARVGRQLVGVHAEAGRAAIGDVRRQVG